jgi:hypothetical protein
MAVDDDVAVEAAARVGVGEQLGVVKDGPVGRLTEGSSRRRGRPCASRTRRMGHGGWADQQATSDKQDEETVEAHGTSLRCDGRGWGARGRAPRANATLQRRPLAVKIRKRTTLHHSGRGSRPGCERVAIAEGLFDLPHAEEEKPPAELMDELVACLESYDPSQHEDPEQELRWKLREIESRYARDIAAHHAAQIGELCVQRLLGPVRYLKERASFRNGEIGQLLTEADWAAIADAKDRLRARVLLDRATVQQRRATEPTAERPNLRLVPPTDADPGSAA